MSQWVEINFDCLPLRTITRLDIPIDASPKYQKRCEDILSAIKKHGSHNSYYLHNASCTYRLLNSAESGFVKFEFEGTVLTDQGDVEVTGTDLKTKLLSETCDWITEPIVQWFQQTVSHSVANEFNLYIQAGDLEKAQKRIEEIEASSDQDGGFLGMYL